MSNPTDSDRLDRSICKRTVLEERRGTQVIVEVGKRTGKPQPCCSTRCSPSRPTR